MEDTHWSARALLSASMVCGIISLVAALMVQESLRRLYSHMDIRLWLSHGVSAHREGYEDPHNYLPLESSVAAHKLVDAPVQFLILAVVLYFLGFGIYLLYGWLYKVAEPSSNFRNILIVYVAVICMSGGYFACLGAWQSLDGQRIHARLKTDRYAPRIHASKEYLNLERIIALLVDFRKTSEEKLQIGTESIENTSLMLDLLLQLWDESESRVRQDARISVTKSKVDPEHPGPTEKGGNDQGRENHVFHAHVSKFSTKPSDPRPEVQHTVSESQMSKQTTVDQAFPVEGKLRTASE